jgi:hypothetical protein
MFRALVAFTPDNYVLTALGGPSSCYKQARLRRVHSQSMSAGNVTWWNPSQGSSGSDWAALYLDSLVPPRQDGQCRGVHA